MRKLSVVSAARGLFNILLDRGYKPKHIKQSIARARQTTRREVLRIDSNTDNTEKVPLVVIYNPALSCLNRVIKEYQPILHASVKMQGGPQRSNIDFIPQRKKPLRPTYQQTITSRPEHHAQLLDDIAIPDLPASKCPVCQADRKCASCRHYGKFAHIIESTNTGETFLIRQYITCQTANAIYVITEKPLIT